MTGKPEQDAIGNEILRISGGKGGAGRLFWRRKAWLAAVWLGGLWVLGQRRLKTFRTGREAERWPKTSNVDEGDDEEQGNDDENDLLVLFGSLGKQFKTFLRCGKKEETTLVAKQSLFMLCGN